MRKLPKTITESEFIGCASPTGEKTIQNQKIPAKPGVYILYSKNERQYIGKTKNLRQRIAQHFGNALITIDMVNPDKIDWVVYSIFESLEQAEQAERVMIKKFRPPYNQKPFYLRQEYSEWKRRRHT